MLTGALRSLFAVVENYPTLKANQNVLKLQEQLTTTENQIGFARQHYNASVLDYNTEHRDLPERPHRRAVRLPRGRDFFRSPRRTPAVPTVNLGFAATNRRRPHHRPHRRPTPPQA